MLHLLLLAGAAVPQGSPPPAALQPRVWQVDGVSRQALVHIPVQGKPKAAPLVFVFHGHGGSSRNAARSFALHEHWPEAIVVYPQGLPTRSGRDPQGSKAGWQNLAGRDGDRDLRFVDTILQSLTKELPIDARHIHATGHSNGGGFTYLLLAQRGDRFASFAPSAASAPAALQVRGKLPLRPVLHLAGTEDQVVPFANQERTIAGLLRLRGAGKAEPWPEVPGVAVHRTSNGAHVATMIHGGTHAFPSDASARIANFFRATPAPVGRTTQQSVLLWVFLTTGHLAQTAAITANHGAR